MYRDPGTVNYLRKKCIISETLRIKLEKPDHGNLNSQSEDIANP